MWPTRVSSSTPVQTKISQLSLAGKELGETPATKELLGLLSLTCVCMRVCVPVRSRVRVCVRVFVRLRAPVCMWRWLRAWPRMRGHTCTHTHLQRARTLATGHLMLIAAQIGREHCPEGCRWHFVRGSFSALFVARVALLFWGMPFVVGIPCIRRPFLSAPLS
jgi:hypothetical protein